MEARICPSGKLLCLSNAKTIDTEHEPQLTNVLDIVADSSLHLSCYAPQVGGSTYAGNFNSQLHTTWHIIIIKKILILKEISY